MCGEEKKEEVMCAENEMLSVAAEEISFNLLFDGPPPAVVKICLLAE